MSLAAAVYGEAARNGAVQPCDRRTADGSPCPNQGSERESIHDRGVAEPVRLCPEHASELRRMDVCQARGCARRADAWTFCLFHLRDGRAGTIPLKPKKDPKEPAPPKREPLPPPPEFHDEPDPITDESEEIPMPAALSRSPAPSARDRLADLAAEVRPTMTAQRFERIARGLLAESGTPRQIADTLSEDRDAVASVFRLLRARDLAAHVAPPAYKTAPTPHRATPALAELLGESAPQESEGNSPEFPPHSPETPGNSEPPAVGTPPVPDVTPDVPPAPEPPESSLSTCPAGHPAACISQADEGTAYCLWCEDKGRLAQALRERDDAIRSGQNVQKNGAAAVEEYCAERDEALVAAQALRNQIADLQGQLDAREPSDLWRRWQSCLAEIPALGRALLLPPGPLAVHDALRLAAAEIETLRRREAEHAKELEYEQDVRDRISDAIPAEYGGHGSLDKRVAAMAQDLREAQREREGMRARLDATVPVLGSVWVEGSGGEKALVVREVVEREVGKAVPVVDGDDRAWTWTGGTAPFVSHGRLPEGQLEVAQRLVELAAGVSR